MKKQTSSKGYRGSIESLENRNMLAGNVSATVAGGALVAFGDGSSNAILVEQVGANSFKITGIATSVNGSSAKTFTGVTNGIFLDMRGGNDIVTLKNLKIYGQTGGVGLGILMGDGADVLLATGVCVFDGITSIDTGEGSDATTIDNCKFNNNFGFAADGGNDAFAFSRSTVMGAAAIFMGDGTNALTMLSDKILQNPTMVLCLSDIGSNYPSGVPALEGILDTLRDDFGDLEIECGALITGGDGVDAFALNSVQIDCLTEIETFGGADSVAIASSRFGNTLLALPSGPLESVGLCIETDLGSDAVAITSTTVYGFLQIDTSGDQPCVLDEVAPAKLVEVNDGIDAVSLVKVNVLSALPTSITETTEYVGLQSGSLLIYTGNQSDAVALAFVNTDAAAFIYTTRGAEDSLDGADSVAIASSSFNRLNHVFPMDGILLIPATGLAIVTGRGSDAVSIASVKVRGDVNIQTGDGSDKVAINALTADRIFVDLGEGNYDALAIASSTAGYARFDGGSGIGDILTRALNHFTSEDHFNFEFVV